MGRQGTGRRWRAGVLAAALAASSGCVCCLCPVAPVSDDAAARAAALPPACKSHVYIFLINGEAPFDLANLGGLRDALIALGYGKTYRGEWYHAGYFKDEILRLRRDDGSARFVVMGFGQGGHAARDLADAAGHGGATIDLLVYCGDPELSRWMGQPPPCRPANVSRVVHLLRDGENVPGGDGEVIHYAGGGPFASSGEGYPMKVLARELEEVASNVRVVDLHPAAEPLPEMLPPPRAVEARETMPRDDWDFLKPTPPNPRVPPRQPDMPRTP